MTRVLFRLPFIAVAALLVALVLVNQAQANHFRGHPNLAEVTCDQRGVCAVQMAGEATVRAHIEEARLILGKYFLNADRTYGEVVIDYLVGPEGEWYGFAACGFDEPATYINSPLDLNASVTDPVLYAYRC